MKRIFFAAALAVVALGGAFTANANTYFNDGSSTAITCNGVGASCIDQKTGSDLYRLAGSHGQQGDAVPESEYVNLEFQP